MKRERSGHRLALRIMRFIVRSHTRHFNFYRTTFKKRSSDLGPCAIRIIRSKGSIGPSRWVSWDRWSSLTPP